MAKITQDVNPTQDPEYIRASRGAQPYDANKGWGAALGGIGEAVQGATEATYGIINRKIENEVTAKTDLFQGAQGVDAAVDQVNKGAVVSFPGSGTFAETAARLSAAYQAGSISPTQYHAQLTAMSRQVRAKFPGFRDEVDKIIEKTTGIRPANALQNDIYNALAEQSSSADKESNYWRQYWKDKVKYLEPADQAKLDMTKDNPELRGKVQVLENRDYQMGVAKDNLANAAAQGKLNKESAISVAIRDLNNESSKILGPSLMGKIDELQKAVASGKTPDPEQMRQLAPMLAQIEAQAEAAFNAKLNTSVDSKNPNGPSYATLIGDPDELKKLRDNAMVNIRGMTKAFTDGNYGLLFAAANSAKYLSDYNYGDALAKIPVFQSIDTLQRALGPMATNTFLGDPAFFKDATGAYSLLQASKMVSGQTNMNQVMDEHIEATKGKPGASPAQGLKTSFDTMQKLMLDPNVPPEARANTAKSLFGDASWLGRLKTYDQQKQTYMRFASDAVLNNMLKIRDSDPQAFKAYTGWVYKNFATLQMQNLQSIEQNNNGDRLLPDRYSIVFDEGKGQFKIVQNDLGKGDQLLSGVQDLLRGSFKAVDEINSVLPFVTKVAQADGKDTGNSLHQFFSDLLRADGSGFTGNIKPNKPLIQKMLEAIPQDSGSATDQMTPQKQAKADIDLEAKAATYASTYGTGLSEMIAGGESGGDYTRLVNKTDGTKVTEPGLTGMTVAQVLERQKTMKSEGHPSTAIGKFQIISGTLKSLVDDGTLSLNDRFDEATQERAAQGLIRRRLIQAGGDFGKMMDGLGDEWEILKKDPSLRNRVMNYLLSQSREAMNNG